MSDGKLFYYWYREFSLSIPSRLDVFNDRAYVRCEACLPYCGLLILFLGFATFYLIMTPPNDYSQSKESIAWWLKVIDYFLPQQQFSNFDEINTQRKCRILIGILLFSTIFGALVAIIAPIAQDEFDPLDLAIIPAILLFAANLFILRTTGRIQLVSWFVLILFSAFVLLSVVITGGLYSVLTIYILMLPAIATFFLGWRVGMSFTAASLLVLFIIHVQSEAIFEHRLMDPIAVNDWAIIFLAYGPAILLVTTLSWLFEKSQTTATQQMQAVLNQLQLIQIDLTSTQKQADAANQAKSAFLATMSHEIRTPLNGVIGLTGLLLGTKLSTEQQEYVSTVRSSGETLLTIINEILDFSKIEAGKVELENSTFNLRTCVEEALDLVTVTAAEKELELLLDFPTSLPNIFNGDVTRLRQILLNLLSNAVKFTERGEVLVTVDADLLNHQFCELHFRVRDTGPGISARRLDRLFKVFSQADASTTRHYGGTGLGLVISKRLSEIMGGTMWVESQVGKGSCFHFTAQLGVPTDVNQDNQQEDKGLHGLSVLVIDDNETSCTILNHQLRAWGLTPTSARSGKSALEHLHNQTNYDLAILDKNMPELDGLTTAEQIRKRYSQDDLPIIMLTPINQALDENLARYQITASVTKPVKAANLLRAMVHIVGGDVQYGHRQPISASLSPTQTSPQSDEHPLRILLAEDNRVNQMVALKMLNKHGYRADVVSNGIEAVEAIIRQHYDLVLMDIRMPEMDGITATNQIRKNLSKIDQPRIVAVTAEALAGDRERLLNQGMDDYISKPMRLEELLKVVQETKLCCLKKAIPSMLTE